MTFWRKPLYTHAVALTIGALAAFIVVALCTDAFDAQSVPALPAVGSQRALAVHAYVRVLKPDGVGPYKRGDECLIYPSTTASVIGFLSQRTIVRTSDTKNRPDECPKNTPFLIDTDEFQRSPSADRIDADTVNMGYNLR